MAALAAFAAVYLVVFGAGLMFLLRMVSQLAVPGEPGPDAGRPLRTAGITPGPASAAIYGTAIPATPAVAHLAAGE